MSEIKSRRGVYRDLSKSPYEYQSPYGDLFKFPSEKKLEMYARDVQKELDRLNKLLDRNELWKYLPTEILQLVERSTYRAFYRKVVR